MREFLIRARKAPVDPERFLCNVGEKSHVEYLAQVMQQTALQTALQTPQLRGWLDRAIVPLFRAYAELCFHE